MSERNKLAEAVAKYESDTFSASGHKVTPGESQRVADMLIKKWSGEYLDGVLIASALDMVRESDK